MSNQPAYLCLEIKVTEHISKEVIIDHTKDPETIASRFIDLFNEGRTQMLTEEQVLKVRDCFFEKLVKFTETVDHADRASFQRVDLHGSQTVLPWIAVSKCEMG